MFAVDAARAGKLPGARPVTQAGFDPACHLLERRYSFVANGVSKLQSWVGV